MPPRVLASGPKPCGGNNLPQLPSRADYNCILQIGEHIFPFFSYFSSIKPLRRPCVQFYACSNSISSNVVSFKLLQLSYFILPRHVS